MRTRPRPLRTSEGPARRKTPRNTPRTTWALRLVLSGLSALGTLALGAEARADVIYLRPDAPIEGLPADPAAEAEFVIYQLTSAGPDPSAPGFDANDRRTWRPGKEWAVRGRIVDVWPKQASSAEIPALRFQFAKVHEGARGERAVEWLLPVVTIPLSEVLRVEHEVDSLLDLHWLLSNRDDLIAEKAGYDPQTVTVLGNLLWKRHLLHAMGGPTPPGGPLPAAGATYDLREGWLVRLVREGALAPAERARRIHTEQRSGIAYPSLLLEPTGRIADDVLPVNVKAAVRDLLRAAALDRLYGQHDRPGPFGTYYGHPRPSGKGGVLYGHEPPVDGVTHPKLYRLLTAVVHTVCGLAQVQGETELARRARACGLQARAAVIEALEAAALGTLDPLDSSQAPEAMAWAVQSASDDPLVQAELQRELARLRRGPATERLPRLNELLHVDPSAVALVALHVIKADDEWRVPTPDVVRAERGGRARDVSGWIVAETDTHLRMLAPDGRRMEVPRGAVLSIERERGRLIRALVRLARGPDDPGGSADPRGSGPRGPREARAGDVFRGDDTVPVAHDPLYGSMNRLKHEVIEVLTGSNSLLRAEDPRGADHADLFRSELQPLLVDGDEHERRFARTVLASVGFGDEATMREVVERLFRVGLGATEEATDPAGSVNERETLRQQMREDAVVTLSRLAGLAGDGRRSQGERAIGRMVLEEVDGLLDAEAAGWSGDDEKRFFEVVERIARRQVSARPDTLLEHRRFVEREQAKLLVRHQRSHLERLDQQLQQESRRLAPSSASFPSRVEEIERAQERTQRMRERLQQRFGVE